MEDKKICFKDLSMPLKFLVVANWIQLGLLGVYLVLWLRILTYILLGY